MHYLLKISFILFGFSFFFCFASPALAVKTALKMSAGLGYFYSEGKYQNNDTLTLNSMPIFLKAQRGLTSIKISSSVYYFSRKEKLTDKTRSSSGWGESYVSAKQLFKIKRLIDYIDIDGKIKIPSADTTKGLGTAGYDFTLSSTAYYWVSKNWITGSVAYRLRSKQLSNTFSVATSISRALSKKMSAGMLVSYKEAPQPISSDTLENTGFLIWKANKRTKYSFYFIKGLKDQKLDWASGLQASYHW